MGSKVRPAALDASKFKKGFVVLRDPVDRFKSLVAMFCLLNDSRRHRGTALKAGPWSDHGTALLGHHDGAAIAEVVLRNFAKLSTLPYNLRDHWFTQKSFIPPAFFELEDPRFYDMEWLRKNHKASNTTPSASVQISAEQREEILKIYAEDVILYERYIGPAAPNKKLKNNTVGTSTFRDT